MKKILVLLIPCLMAACGSSEQEKPVASADGSKVYRQYCTVCHGADGQLGLNGAFNLATSTLSKEMAMEVITHGRNAMAPYEDLLTEAEIMAVTEYILTLRQ